ncbi:MAG: phosphoribosylamine--glycine ligase [Deferribacterales bacterium]|nr:phosphoribosylamine--glycine ligase [Deferribacterales bacterium]
MNILVIGSGGREHAIAWKLSQEPTVDKIYVAPGNGGTALENKCVNINIQSNDIDALAEFAKNNSIDLTVVGPEEPLSKGIVDEFEKSGLLIFGPCKNAAQIEASKSFAKNVMTAAGIPTADYEKFSDFNAAKKYVEEKGAPMVIKADGLAAGKGVTVAQSIDEAIAALSEIFVDKVFGNSGSSVVIEDFMAGEEATYLAITDGKTILPLVISQDHKPLNDGDKGPNTGGMGAYTPAPVIKGNMFDRVTDEIAYPMIKELAKRGIIYKGVIYAGLMINGNSIKVVEFNCRFGDPECQVVLSRIKTGLLDALLAASKGCLENSVLQNSDNSVACVVLASGGYPKSYKNGYEITGINNANTVDGVKVFHAGTKYDNNKLVTNGGRVLCVAAEHPSLKTAVDNAYKACKYINFTDMHYRNDIAAKAFKKQPES